MQTIMVKCGFVSEGRNGIGETLLDCNLYLKCCINADVVLLVFCVSAIIMVLKSER